MIKIKYILYDKSYLIKLTNKAVPVNEIIKDKNITIKLVIIWNKDIEFKQIKMIFKSFVKLIFSE